MILKIIQAWILSLQHCAHCAIGDDDSIETHFADVMRSSHDTADPVLAQRLVEEGPTTVRWLEELGVHFERTYYPEKAVIQPNTEGLMYTGNEKVWPYKDMAVPAPRGQV